MISYIIVDDEPIAHRIIERYAGNLSSLQKVANCYNAMEAMDVLSNNTVDLIFLDIEMPKLKGFDFLKTLAIKPKVIVTTAYSEYALEGYELQVIDYLLKPFSFERFIKAINKLSKEDNRTLSNSKAKETVDSKSIFIKGDKKYHQIQLNHILFIEALGNYTKVILEDKTIISHLKISEFEKLLPNSFLRVHKSYIVFTPKISIIEGNRISIETHKIPIGQTYKLAVDNILKNEKS